VYNAPVPGVRAEGQQVIAMALDQRLLTALDRERKGVGQDRSTFIRIALIDYLNARGSELSKELAFAPDRSGKGRPRKPIVVTPPGPIDQVVHPGMTLDPAVKKLVDEIVQAHPEPDLNPPAKAQRRGRQRGVD
jgi:hypothetical protein